MIDFTNASYVKLSQWDVAAAHEKVGEHLTHGEQIYLAFKGMRDFVVFTSKRLIAVNVQGITGKKIDYTSLPYARIQAFSVETAGTFDLDSEMDLWFSGLGVVRLEFARGVDIRNLNRLIADHTL
ncbi:PH domain-containing protein [Flavimobilis sp. GY10621]|uniref:PH domain-containing protein n=1 Tax=Flavimobilis rhizosphaerae TaxID=2775421 RepID=A0ABR9DQA0_9MICO|nr:PH domain-containing protein [Flavimobilis rhizosphaerae]MBD9699304.1 PH domain-containing protein [Flavimobilis rhizosphaerae]